MRFARSVLGGFFFVAYALGGLAIGMVVFPALALLGAGRAKRAVVRASWRLFVGLARVTGLFRVEVSPEGRRRLAEARGCVVVANHPSLIDVVILVAMLSDSTALAKAATRRNVFHSLIVRGAFLVNDSPGRLLEEAGRFLSEGVNVVVFPEGSRTPIGGELRPFQRGAAQMAARAHAPVLPVTIDFDPPVLAKGQAWHDLGARTIVVRLRVHDAIEPDSLSGATPHAVAVALTDEAHRRIVGGRRAENLSDASM